MNMANKEKAKQQKVAQRKKRVRAKVSGTAERPRMSIFRSLKFTYVQLIDDQKGVTLASAKASEIKNKGNKTESAEKLGELIAKKAAEKNITKVVFDKSSYKYHGRIKAVAEGARKGGLIF